MKFITIILIIAAIFFLFGCEETPNESPYNHNSVLEGYLIFEDAQTDTISAAIEVYDENNGIIVAETNTDTAGYYYIENLPEGQFQLQFTAENYETFTYTGIELSANKTLTLDTLQLDLIEPIEFKEIIIDGSIDEDWNPIYTNNHPSNWSSSNEIENLYLAHDDNYLYIGLEAAFESQNSLNLYLDKDYGNDTGLNNFNDISSNLTDGRLQKEVTCTDNFGADIRFCAWREDNPEVVEITQSEAEDASIDAEIFINYTDNYVEIAIPVTIYSNDTFPSGKIGLVALIGGGETNSYSNDSIPQPASGFTGEFSNVFVRSY